jgi:hypothetical protein
MTCCHSSTNNTSTDRARPLLARPHADVETEIGHTFLDAHTPTVASHGRRFNQLFPLSSNVTIILIRHSAVCSSTGCSRWLCRTQILSHSTISPMNMLSCSPTRTCWVPTLSSSVFCQLNALPNQGHEAVTGIKAVVTALLSQVHSTWLLRNEHLHGTDPLQQTLYKRFYLLAQIRELYDTAPLMLAGDRDILAFSFDRRQVQNTETLHTFYVWAKPLVDHSIHVANELGSRFRRIDDYFRPIIPPELCEVIL